MIMDNFTQIPNNASIVEYAFAFDVSLNRLPIITIFFAILIVLTVAIFSWNKDFVESALFADFLIIVSGLISTLIISDVFFNVSGVPMRLLEYESLTVFIIWGFLLVLYKFWTDG